MRFIQSHAGIAGLAALLLTGAAAVAIAQPTPTPEPATTGTYTAALAGDQEVPPVATAATGTATINLDTETMELSWSVEFSGLSGPVTAAHFHGPAAVGANAGPVIDILAVASEAAAGAMAPGGAAMAPAMAMGAAGEVASPIEGSIQITAEQVAELNAGMWYVNLHTAANPNGEIRGQVTTQSGEQAPAGAAGVQGSVPTPPM